MAVKDIRKPPVQVRSAKVAKALKSALYRAVSDAFVVGTSTQPALLFNVPKYVSIDDIKIHTTTAITGASPDTLIVGTSADSDMFHSSSDTTVLGSHSMKYGSALQAGGLITSTGAITVTADWSTGSSAGGFYAEIIYSAFSSDNFVYP